MWGPHDSAPAAGNTLNALSGGDWRGRSPRGAPMLPPKAARSTRGGGSFSASYEGLTVDNET